MSSINNNGTNGCSPVTPDGDKPRPKGSYPSRQQRFGAAPLASFEDLPSDDQNSPDDDDDYDPHTLSDDRVLPPGVKHVLDLDSSQLLMQKSGDSPGPALSPTLTITPTGACGERKTSDSASQNTLTLGSDSATPVPAGSNSASLSSLKPDGDGQRQIGSHNSLLTVPDGNGRKGSATESKRKGSWTDIFFPGRSRSKSTSSSPRKSPTAERKRSVFTKFFGGGGGRSKSPSKESSQSAAQSREPSSAIESVDTPRVSVTDTSENEPNEELMIGSPINDPKPSEQDIIGILEAAHSQMESIITTPVSDYSGSGAEPIPLPLPPLNLRKTLKRRESTIDDDVQSLPEILPSSLSSRQLIHDNIEMTTNDNINRKTVVVQIESTGKYEDNSSESEVGTDENNRLKVKAKSDGKTGESDDDFEAQNLLTQDSIDYDETSFTESFAANMALMTAQTETIRSPTYKERLEVLTIPIDRPRSTTPINIVPLEAYIRSSSISPDPTVEKIKLSLPGEQFTQSARAKSPRKSNPSIWFEFCEKGLQSPLQRRKQRANSCFPSVDTTAQPTPFINASDAFGDAFTDAFTLTAANQALMTPSPGNLTPITPLENFGDNKWPGFGDNFVNFDSILSTNGGATIDGVMFDRFSCKCECNTNNSTNNSGAAATNCPTGGISEELVIGGDGSPDPSLAGEDSLNKSNNINEVNVTTDHEYMEDQPLVSPCHCLCHRRADFALTLWKSSSFSKQESISSDISSASSRLIGSSSSNSKCSPSDDILESLNS